MITVTNLGTSAARCFGTGDPLYEQYHDTEWGRPIHDENALYEKLCLEAFQSGLSWSTVLHKREAFREVFRGFDPEKVATFGDRDMERLLADARIIRNRMKISACVTNAKAVVAMHSAGEQLCDLIWSFQPDNPDHCPMTFDSVPAQTEESQALAKALKKRGFAFVGPTTIYAMMQACGLVNDHLASCPARQKS